MSQGVLDGCVLGSVCVQATEGVTLKKRGSQ